VKTRSLLIKTVIVSALSVVLFANVSTVACQKKWAITATGEGLILTYNEEIHWDKEQFDQEYQRYSENKARYLKDFIESFSGMFLGRGLKASNWSISFNSQYELETEKTVYSTLIQCQIDGAASGTAESPYFRTEWLLMPLLGREIDLYNFKYLTDKILVYEGEVNHVPTKITFGFSKPISHCHYHIWYK